jgi:hypothetical protein
MKKLILILLMCFNSFVYAQTLAEWTQQKKTQIKYLVQQIAALQVYATYVEQGYSIARSGLNMIQDIKKGDFNLHSDYFSSLKNVNPAVKSYSKIAEIVAMQISIVKACHQQRLNMNNSNQFNGDEISYAGKVFGNVLNGCTEIIDQIIVITTDGLLQMKDDERIKRIDHLYKNMQDRFSFVQHFGNDNSILAVQRMKDQNDVQVSRELFGIH